MRTRLLPCGRACCGSCTLGNGAKVALFLVYSSQYYASYPLSFVVWRAPNKLFNQSKGFRFSPSCNWIFDTVYFCQNGSSQVDGSPIVSLLWGFPCCVGSPSTRRMKIRSPSWSTRPRRLRSRRRQRVLTGCLEMVVPLFEVLLKGNHPLWGDPPIFMRRCGRRPLSRTESPPFSNY